MKSSPESQLVKTIPVIIGYCRAYFMEPRRALSIQRGRLEAIGAQECFEEQVGFFGSADQLEKAIHHANRGDVLVATRPYRVALTQKSVVNLIRRLGQKGAGLRILDSPLDTSTTTGRMLIGSAPLWSLGITPWRSLMHDLSVGQFLA